VDHEVLSDRIMALIGASTRPLSAREIGASIECNSYELRSALFRLRQSGEVKAALNGEPLPPGEEPQPLVALAPKPKRKPLNGHRPNGQSTVKEELLSIIEAMVKGPIVTRLVRLYTLL
jgi:hypothetical protein